MFYIYDAETKIYSHSTEGQLDPLGGGQLTPPFSTTIEPIFTTGEVAVYENSTWVIKADNTAVDAWNISDASKVEFSIGDVVDSTMTLIEPTQTYPLWDVNKWIEDPVKTAQAIEDAKPKVVTMRQARLALLQQGLLVTTTDAITTGTDEAMKIEWEYATEVKRDWPSLIALTTSLGMTSVQLDELFQLASTL